MCRRQKWCVRDSTGNMHCRWNWMILAVTRVLSPIFGGDLSITMLRTSCLTQSSRSAWKRGGSSKKASNAWIRRWCCHKPDDCTAWKVWGKCCGYVSGRLLVQQEQQGCRVVAPVLPETSWQQQTGFGVGAFALDWQRQQAVCPAGQSSRQWTPKRDKRGEAVIQIFFAKSTCQGREHQEQCTRSEKGGRTLTVYPREIHDALQERQASQKTASFQQDDAVRSGIEGTLSEVVRAHGMRRSRYRGREKTHLQMVSVAAAINLVRIHQMLLREQTGLPPRRVRAPSAFARLQERMEA